ncbi:hypothetical protein MSG28_007194 [Choristoneura fumiferana]|uniref:Uncharacterized protein n=1 Tax=Choristoneura fumiferana TaxID=7141 RepID=A0ACC0JMU9_CHOFU|nr:hypothetical protein MSG28_007194 [Choristoneura fumiferana]
MMIVSFAGWRAIYKGECSAFVRTYPTKSSDIRKRISSYITEYFNRTPTTAAPGVAFYDDMRKYGPSNLEYYDVNLDSKSRNKGAQRSKRGQITKNIVGNKHNRQGPYRGELHGDVRNHYDMGRKGRGQNGPNQKDRGQNGHSLIRPIGSSLQQKDMAGNLQVHINNNRIGEPSQKVPGRKGAGRNGQKKKELHRRGENTEVLNGRSLNRKNSRQNDDGQNGQNRKDFRKLGRYKRDIVGYTNNNLKNLKDTNREVTGRNNSGQNYQSRKEGSRKSRYLRNKDHAKSKNNFSQKGSNQNRKESVQKGQLITARHAETDNNASQIDPYQKVLDINDISRDIQRRKVPDDLYQSHKILSLHKIVKRKQVENGTDQKGLRK